MAGFDARRHEHRIGLDGAGDGTAVLVKQDRGEEGHGNEPPGTDLQLKPEGIPERPTGSFRRHNGIDCRPSGRYICKEGLRPALVGQAVGFILQGTGLKEETGADSFLLVLDFGEPGVENGDGLAHLPLCTGFSAVDTFGVV
jgi:hypothetical protein